jgi:chromosome segregation ATPase
VKQFVVALAISQFVAGCVATTDELKAVKAKISFEQQEHQTQQERLEKRMAIIEANLEQIEGVGLIKTQQDKISKRMAAIEAELQKIEKSSALAMQMGLISTVHADSNDRGIASLRAELDKLTAEIQVLHSRLVQSDKKLESGLLQLKNLSMKLK